MAGKNGQKKRFWSDDEKRSICAQTPVPGMSVAQVARRYAMNADLIHNWSNDPRSAPEPEIDDPDYHGGFLPVEIEDTVAVAMIEDAREPDGAVCAQRVDMTLANGRRILVEGPTGLSSVLALVKGVMASSRCCQTHGIGWRLA